MKINFLLTALVVAVVAWAPKTLQAESLTVGYLTDLSGKGAFWGQQSTLGASIAVEEIIAAGGDIKVIFADHRSDSTTAVTEANRMLTVEHASAILSDLTAPSVAIAPILARHKVLMIHFSPSRSIADKNPYAFRLFIDYQAGCRAVAQKLKQTGHKKLLVIKANFEFGELCLAGAREIFPELYELSYDTGQDLRSEILHFANKQVDAIIQTGYEADYISAFKRLREINQSMTYAMPFLLLTDPVRTAARQANLKRVLNFGFSNDGSQEFQAKLLKAGGKHGLVNWQAAALAYLGVHQIFKAATACGNQDVNCQVKVMNEIRPSAGELLGFAGYQQRAANFEVLVQDTSF